MVRKKSSETPVCIVDTGVGRRSSTVMPPSSACSTTRLIASAANGRSRRCSGCLLAYIEMVSTSVRIITVPAASRWLCSTSTPPSIFGIIVP